MDCEAAAGELVEGLIEARRGGIPEAIQSKCCFDRRQIDRII